MKSLAVCLFLTSAALSQAFINAPLSVAFQDRQSGLIIGLESTPADVPTGGPAKFEGAVVQTATLGGEMIRVKITPPGQASEIRDIRTNNDGTFNLVIPNCLAGQYRVEFSGRNGGAAVTRTFNVVDWNQVKNEMERKFREELDRAVRVAERIRKDAMSAPQGANRDEALRRVGQIQSEHQRLRSGVDRMTASAGALQRLSAAPPRIRAAAAEVLSDFSTAADEFQQNCSDLREFEARQRTNPGMCDSLENAAEGLRFVATATSALLSPLETLKTGIQTLLQPAQEAENPAPDPNITFATETVKTELQAARQGMTGILASLPELANSTSQFFIDKLFKQYCSTIEGPVTAEFSVNAKDGGKPFYSYKVILEAKMKLWADKTKPATPQGLEFTGRLEGGATKVEFTENILNVEPLPSGSQLVLKKIMTPPVLKKADINLIGSGTIARAANPGHFNVRYIGSLTESGIKLRQESVVDDFTPLFQNRVMVVAILPGGIVPGVTTFNFPIQKGAWIIDRSTKGAFELPRVASPNSILLKNTVTRNETTSGGIVVTWKVVWDLKSTN